MRATNSNEGVQVGTQVAWLTAKDIGRTWFRCIWSMLALSVMAGCASLSPADTDEWRDSQTIRLMERANGRWAALIAGDFPKAYEYQSPGYRAVASLQHFRGGFKGNVDWRMAQANRVQYDSPVSASVSVSVTYDASVLRGGNFRSVRDVHEKWVYSDDNWWYVSVN